MKRTAEERGGEERREERRDEMRIKVEKTGEVEKWARKGKERTGKQDRGTKVKI